MTITADSEAAIYLADVQHLFGTADIDPLRGETIHDSGIDQLLDVLKARPRSAPPPERIIIHLPVSSAIPDLAALLQASIGRYCGIQRRLAQQKLNETRIEAQYALVTGLIIWAVCLAAFTLFVRMFEAYGIQNQLFSEGFIIAGWVSLWRPVELIFYEWRPYAREMQLFDEIRKMSVEIVTHPDDKPLSLVRGL